MGLTYQSFKETFGCCGAGGVNEPEMILQFMQLEFLSDLGR
jgi:hypothetical protein